MQRTVFLIAIVFAANLLHAQVRLPKIFGHNMVLQRDRPVMVWGWSSPGEKITVQLDKQTKKVTANRNGKWKVALDPMQAGGPFKLTVKGKNSVSLENILIGEVWICSGQSNMEWNVANSNDSEKEIANANYPMIRHIKVPNVVAGEPQDDISAGSWEVCSPETAGDFTAVGYFFARELMKEMDVPIGLINTSWGGTHVETWISREAFLGTDEFRPMIASVGRINLDSMRAKNEEQIAKQIERLQGQLPASASAAVPWKDAAFKDSEWPKMRLPGLWEDQAPGDVDGVIWFRTTFTLDAANAGKEAVLNLGPIDDNDETYVNGVKIGSTRDYRTKRVYTIPVRTLREGKNVIAVRVEDTGGGGGFYGDPGDINVSFGGKAEPLAGDWSYQIESVRRTVADVSPNQFPTLLFNAMINPLIPFTIRGALWYQGESNAGRAYQYRKSFPLMISDWRKRWGLGDFPFYLVQLASYDAGGGTSNKGSSWAELREAQAMTLSLPNTGMAVTTDIGDPADIHPRNKQDVGRRLAALALRDIFGKQIVASGPVYKSFKVQGNKAVVTFSSIGGGLMAKDKYGYLKGFEIAGADRKFYYAQAQIDGDRVIVSHEKVNDPQSVRYGWADDASDCNLFNAEGFPAAPFRTDQWPGVTESAKFNVRRAVQ